VEAFLKACLKRYYEYDGDECNDCTKKIRRDRVRGKKTHGVCIIQDY
jgi:hypothetical protein